MLFAPLPFTGRPVAPSQADAPDPACGPYAPSRQPGRLVATPGLAPALQGSVVPLAIAECAMGLPFGGSEWQAHETARLGGHQRGERHRTVARRLWASGLPVKSNSRLPHPSARRLRDKRDAVVWNAGQLDRRQTNRRTKEASKEPKNGPTHCGVDPQTSLVDRQGFEPWTLGLRVPCSTS